MVGTNPMDVFVEEFDFKYSFKFFKYYNIMKIPMN